MLDVSSVWCGPCNEAASTSMEVFEAIREVHPSTWLVTLMVQDLFAAPATVKDTEEWVESYDIEYPVVVDDGEAVRREYGVLAFPVFLFIAPTGEIYERNEGILEDAEILDLMEFGLEEWAAGPASRGRDPRGWRRRVTYEPVGCAGDAGQTTTNCPIIPSSSCSRMWQWYMYGVSGSV